MAIRKRELAKLYGINRATLYRWFKRHPQLTPLCNTKRLLTPMEIELVRELLGPWE